MRKFALFCIASLVMVATALPAYAEHSNVDAYWDAGPHDGSRWNETHTEQFCISPEFYNSGLTQSQEANVEATAEEAFNRWQVNTDISVEINLGSGSAQCNWNLNFNAAYDNAGGDQEDFCDFRPSDQASSIQFEQSPIGGTGMTWNCDVDSNGYVDYFVIVVDPDILNAGVQWGYAATPSNGEWDFLGLMMHEVGHAYGFKIHWGSGSTACQQTHSAYNTMCAGWGYKEGAGGTANRTLETHDIEETNQEYP